MPDRFRNIINATPLRGIVNINVNIETIKTLWLVLALFSLQDVSAKTNAIKVDDTKPFYFQYVVEGPGANSGFFFPKLTVNNTKFIFTKEHRGYFGVRSPKKNFRIRGVFQQRSINSILDLVYVLKDSTIYKTNPCIMSGAVIYVTVAHGTDTTKFMLHNTSDSIASKIIDIVNPYLPKGHKLCCSVERIKDEQQCREFLMQRAKIKIGDSSNIKQ